VLVSLISASNGHVYRKVPDHISKLCAEFLSTPVSRTLDVRYRIVQLGNISKDHNQYLKKNQNLKVVTA
jgi:hypothetical protein